MPRLHRLAGLASLALLLAAGPVVADDEKVKFADLPKAVRKTIRVHYPQAEIVGASKEKEDGETKYEVEMTIDGKAVDVVLDDEGEIEAVERTIEVSDLPSAVVKAARAKFKDTKIEKVEEITAEGEIVVYELTFTLGGEKIEVIMSPNGKIIDSDDDEDEEKPKPKDDDKADAKKKKD